MKQVFGFIGLGILIVAVLFGVRGLVLGSNAFWGPKEAIVARNVYQNTPSYVNGNLADLRDLRDQIKRAKDPEDKAELKAALNDKINHLPADFIVPSDVSDAANN